MSETAGKRKIAFILTRFVVGGVEKSFLDLLECIDREQYDVTVFLPDSEGEWTETLCRKCRVRYLKNEAITDLLFSQLARGQLISAFRTLIFRCLAFLYRSRNYRKSTEYFARSMSRVKEYFDCAVAYQIINDDCVLGTLFRVRAGQKVVWSHAYIHKTEGIYGRWYDMFDKLFCVSEYARQALTQNYPCLTAKTDVFYNTINTERIRRMAMEPVELPGDENAIRIVTIGRLSPEKGQTLITKAARLLLEAGHRITWLIVGDGPLKDEIAADIHKEQLDDHVFLLGNRDNPYPYILSCDIYVQTSALNPGEGWGLTISEAKVLMKPIVTTASGAIQEQIQDGITGLLVDSFSSEKLAERIGYLIERKELRQRFSAELEKENLSHGNEIQKLYRIVGARGDN